MSYKVPSSPDSSQTSSPGTSASEDFHLAIEYLPEYSAIMSDIDIMEYQSPSKSLANFTTEDINNVLRVLAALKNAPPEAQGFVQNSVDGKR
ncbi:hypothetical protein GcM3_014022 [Golovinomyces cichoracearum]|uniref:Uncharacterized protein n=1 Tax=Golovinomyces cichoracearum TaxID=62708 RepID=A0A420J989_9PEZI|nr:hypothetical protein GcM3_014022 [Golovinomyces cichoracearum]